MFFYAQWTYVAPDIAPADIPWASMFVLVFNEKVEFLLIFQDFSCQWNFILRSQVPYCII